MGCCRFSRTSLAFYLTIDNVKEGIIGPVEGNNPASTWGIVQCSNLGTAQLRRLVKLVLRRCNKRHTAKPLSAILALGSNIDAWINTVSTEIDGVFRPVCLDKSEVGSKLAEFGQVGVLKVDVADALELDL
jgi:hypothetical protein